MRDSDDITTTKLQGQLRFLQALLESHPATPSMLWDG